MFGFLFKNKKEGKRDLTFSVDDSYDGSYVMDAAGHYGTYMNIGDEKVNNEKELILRYRSIAKHTECENAINDIVNEAINGDDNSSYPVRLNLTQTSLSAKLKKTFNDEFKNIMDLVNIKHEGHDIFKKWYIDGRLYYYKIIDSSNPKSGIQEVRQIDPLKIRKVRNIKKSHDPEKGHEVFIADEEFYIYQNSSANSVPSKSISGSNTQGVKISKDSVTFVSSGLLDHENSMTLSHLNKAVKPVNQLRMIEDALIIYRISRAPERRIFYVDVGKMTKSTAEQYVRNLINKYRHKTVYESSTGEIKSDKRHMNMTEDFWLPRQNGNKGTEIETLPGGDNLGKIEDVEYFRTLLYNSLNVPASRLDPEQQTLVSLGRTSEITRDELKYQKFINRLRQRFSALFIDMLKTQLILKGVVTAEEWEDIESTLIIDYIADLYISESKKLELLQSKISVLSDIDSYKGEYYSKEWIMQNVLAMTEEEIKDMEKSMKKESGELEEAEDDDDGEEGNVNKKEGNDKDSDKNNKVNKDETN